MGTDGLVGVVDVLAAVEVLVVCCVWRRRRKSKSKSKSKSGWMDGWTNSTYLASEMKVVLLFLLVYLCSSLYNCGFGVSWVCSLWLVGSRSSRWQVDREAGGQVGDGWGKDVHSDLPHILRYVC